MATRFYFSTETWPDISPNLSPLWDKVDSASMGNALITAPESATNFWSSMQTIDPAENPLPCKTGFYSFVSPPLAAQTISGTVKGQMFAEEWTAGSGCCQSVVIRVLSGDGETERGVLLAEFPEELTSEFPEAYDNNGDGHPTYQNRKVPPPSDLTPVDCEDGDVIVVEFGATRFAVGNPDIDDESQVYELWAYSEGNGDLPEDETTLVNYDEGTFSPYTVAQLDPWIEFSQNLNFQGSAPSYEFQGNMGLSLEPTSVNFADYSHEGNAGIALTPSSVSGLRFSHQGNVELAIAPAGRDFANYVHRSSVGFTLEPSADFGELLAITLRPHALSSWLYAANIPLSLAPHAASSWLYPGQVPLTLAPHAQVTTDQQYAGNVSLSLSPHGAPSGLERGHISLALTPASTSSGPAVPKNTIEATGGVKVSGETTVDFHAPNSVDFAGEGGVQVGGSCPVTFKQSITLGIVSVGGVQVGGKAQVDFVSPDMPTSFVSQGGVVVSGTPDLNFIKPDTLEVVPTGGVKVGGLFVAEVDFQSPTEVVATISSRAVALKVGGEAPVNFITPNVYVAPEIIVALMIGGSGCATFIRPQVFEVIGEAEIAINTPDLNQNGPCDTWALNGQAYEPSIFTGFNFNSYALHHGNAYGAGEDGIYLLEGEDDAGRPIHTGARIGPVNFGTSQDKRLRGIQIGDAGVGTKIKVTVEGKSGYFGTEWDDDRIVVSRDLQGREFTLDFSDFKQLSQLDITVLRLNKR